MLPMLVTLSLRKYLVNRLFFFEFKGDVESLITNKDTGNHDDDVL